MFTKKELKMILCAIEKMDCSACIFQYECECDNSGEYCPCDEVKHKIVALDENKLR